VATKLNLDVDAGATFGSSLVFRNPDGSTFNLAGFSGKLQVRERVDADEVVLDVTPQLNGGGLVTFGFTAAETDTLTKDQYVYALELYGPNDLVIRLIEGFVNVSARVVRD
jgi:hypothetical protein